MLKCHQVLHKLGKAVAASKRADSNVERSPIVGKMPLSSIAYHKELFRGRDVLIGTADFTGKTLPLVP